MKTSKLLIIAAISTSSLFAFNSAKASSNPLVGVSGLVDVGTSSTSNSTTINVGISTGVGVGGTSTSGSGDISITLGGGSGSGSGSGSGAALPINNGVWFLLLAGVAVGTKVLLSKTKEASIA